MQLEQAEWLNARGRPDDAGPLIAEADETFERLGAVQWLEQVACAPVARRERTATAAS
jgi:hypothetical protein